MRSTWVPPYSTATIASRSTPAVVLASSESVSIGFAFHERGSRLAARQLGYGIRDHRRCFMFDLLSAFVDRFLDRVAEEDGVIPVILIVIAVILILAIIGLFSVCGDGD
jgi:hypothetical protein